MGQGQTLIPGYRAYLLAKGAGEAVRSPYPNTWEIPEFLDHLSTGDIIRISPRSGNLWVMYRRDSGFNTMLLTERCNSYCVMCSQPPKPGDDSYLVQSYLDAIPLMSTDTRELGITGGEPTLLGEGLLEIIRKCKKHFRPQPFTCCPMAACSTTYRSARAVAAIDHPDLIVGVPLYSDIPHRHDFVVQAEGSLTRRFAA